MKKLEESNVQQGSIESKRLKLICCMFELTYTLMMDNDYAINSSITSLDRSVGIRIQRDGLNRCC